MAATIKDVALKANVSVATVSRVLNGTAKVSDTAFSLRYLRSILCKHD